jgi:hemoglobin-like flavoprotein
MQVRCRAEETRSFMRIIKTFMPLVNASSSNHNVSEGDFYNNTQSFMFAHCPVSNIFNVTNQQSIGTNKHLIFSDNT